MVACIMIGGILFIILIGLLAYFIPLIDIKKTHDNRTASQKILDHFKQNEQQDDLNSFIAFCKENPVEYKID